MRITRVVIAIVVGVLAATSVLAQQRKPIPRGEMDKYVVSAKAGVVNLAEGDTKVIRAQSSAAPEMLISGDELQSGDTVKTGTGARAEILLNPGCYLRLGEQSEFVFLFDNFTSDKLKLLRGSAVIEASAIESPIVVETPKANFDIARDGLYRFNVDADGKAEVAVRKGRVSTGGATIKQGKRAVVAGSALIGKLNKKDTDALDDWSKDRSKALIALNSGLSNVGMSRTLGMSFMRNAWIYDPFCRCYTFLPFGAGCSSPYGWNYTVGNPYGYYYYSGSRYNHGGSYGSGNSGSGSHTSGGSSGNPGGGVSTGGGFGSTGGATHSPPASSGAGSGSRGAPPAGPRKP